ncbi:hypothetical protein F4778DRAFT_728046 [Xylariomycetidae sp. FL2044]|nr:hypothetical protein F4778DRAFT_728046 [Xylariomycetidae sp. FL2044]
MASFENKVSVSASASRLKHALTRKSRQTYRKAKTGHPPFTVRRAFINLLGHHIGKGQWLNDSIHKTLHGKDHVRKFFTLPSERKKGSRALELVLQARIERAMKYSRNLQILRCKLLELHASEKLQEALKPLVLGEGQGTPPVPAVTRLVELTRLLHLDTQNKSMPDTGALSERPPASQTSLGPLQGFQALLDSILLAEHALLAPDFIPGGFDEKKRVKEIEKPQDLLDFDQVKSAFYLAEGKRLGNVPKKLRTFPGLKDLMIPYMRHCISEAKRHAMAAAPIRLDLDWEKVERECRLLAQRVNGRIQYYTTAMKQLEDGKYKSPANSPKKKKK